MGNRIFKKTLFFAVTFLLIFTNITSAYSEIENLKVKNITEKLDDNQLINNGDLIVNKLRKESDNEFKQKILLRSENLINKQDKIDNINFKQGPFKSELDEEWDIIVPDDFSTIQKAIDNADIENGYKIFVRNGTYFENVNIVKNSVILHGENKVNTVISGNGVGDIIKINANYVNISGFTIKDSGITNSAINIEKSNGNKIFNNILKNNCNGISIINYSHANNISKNILSENNQHGIFINNFCTNNIIFDNSIYNNDKYGIFINEVSRSNMISWNTLRNNSVGINCSSVSDANLFHHNNLINNKLNAFDSSDNIWDDSAEGNHWSDYNGTDNDGDGIGDEPYLIFGGINQDNYPLINESFSGNLLKKGACLIKKIISGNTINKKVQKRSYFNNLISVPEDYSQIQHAINNANHGDTIKIKAGVYHENIIVNKSVKIISENPDKTIIDGGSENDNISYSLEIIDQFQSFSSASYFYGSHYAQSFIPSLNTITKVKLYMQRNGAPKGLKISIKSDLLGDDLTFVDVTPNKIPKKADWIEFDLPNISVKPFEKYYLVFKADIIDKDNSFGWYVGHDIASLSGIFDHYITGCAWYFSGVKWFVLDHEDAPNPDFTFEIHGILSLPKKDENIITVTADNVEISGLTILNCSPGFSGIKLYGNSCNLNNNKISSCGGGIEIFGSHNISVCNNSIKNNIWGLYVDNVANCVIKNNNIFCNLYGAEVGFSNLEFFNNNISNNYFIGILGLWINNNTYDKNNISWNYDIGIQFFSSNKNNISNNYFYKNIRYSISTYKSKHNYIFNNIMNFSGVSFWTQSDMNVIEKNDIKVSIDGAVINYNSNLNKVINNRFSYPCLSGPKYLPGEINTCSQILLFFKCENNIIINNEILQTWSLTPGIQLNYATNHLIEGNNLMGKEWTPAIYIRFSCCNCIRNNKILCYGNTIYFVLPKDGIRLFYGYNMDILNNTIENFDVGLHPWLVFSNITISNNVINNNRYGIKANSHVLDLLLYTKNNLNIKNNIISNSKVIGLRLEYCKTGNIIENNFIDNRIHASFVNSFSINWRNNFWKRHIFGPKIILGRFGPIPWLNFDLSPAKEPHNI